MSALVAATRFARFPGRASYTYEEIETNLSQRHFFSKGHARCIPPDSAWNKRETGSEQERATPCQFMNASLGAQYNYIWMRSWDPHTHTHTHKTL